VSAEHRLHLPLLAAAATLLFLVFYEL